MPAASTRRLIDQPAPNEPDIVVRMLELVRDQLPELAPAQARAIEQQIRSEFGGGQVYLRARRSVEAEVSARWDGRNHVQLARELGVGRSTVYRVIERIRSGRCAA